MEHSYTAQYPSSISISQDVVSFFEHFYRVSDTADAHEEYARIFAPDATFILASRTSRGHDAILETRRGMWAAVSSRKHTVFQVYPFGTDTNEFMLRGGVDYQAKNGDHSSKDWAAYAKLITDESGKLQFQYYQVYLVSADTLIREFCML